MSTSLAIAATTAVLQSILTSAVKRDGVDALVTEFSASAFAPDQVPLDVSPVKSYLNLFLYHVSPNPGWRNLGLPMRDSRGDRISKPPLALDLHYLLSGYAADELQSQAILAAGMLALFELPLLTRDAILDAFKPPPPPAADTRTDLVKKMATAGLDTQVESIKVAPSNLSPDDISKIMNGFQNRMRASACYQVTVVLIESRGSARSALPVRRLQHPDVYLFSNPTIASVEPQMVIPAPGVTITLRGHDLLAGVTSVRFGGAAEQTPDAASTGFVLTAPLPANLPAGINTVQIIQQLAVGEARSLRRGFESNLAALVVQPVVAKKTVGGQQVYDITIANTSGAGDEPRAADITVKLAPAVGKRQRATLYLNEKNPPADGPAHGYSFEAPPRDLPTEPDTRDTLTWRVEGVHAGAYLLRVRIDGADTPLDVDAGGAYDKPELTL
jgi:hypothetical protein